MATTNRNRDFRAAQTLKKDEFYTSLRDIEHELAHYKPHFKGKTVYCNCDDPRVSNFFHYFVQNFEALKLKKLITTCYSSQEGSDFSHGISGQAVFLEYTGTKHVGTGLDADEIGIQRLAGNGDFRSAESIELLQQADIVVTPPPFSLFKDYVAQLVEHQKQFIIMGNMNAVTYKEIFQLFQDNKMWYGPSIRSGDREFRVPHDYPLVAAGTRVSSDGTKYIRVKGVRWFTNLDYPRRCQELKLTRSYNKNDYPKYVNYDAIDVSKSMSISSLP